jgi:predicted nucleic-acid-binding Zn-ribbon protein
MTYKSGLHCPRCGCMLQYHVCGANEANLLHCKWNHYFWVITKRCNHSDLFEAEEYNHTSNPEIKLSRSEA